MKKRMFISAIIAVMLMTGVGMLAGCVDPVSGSPVSISVRNMDDLAVYHGKQYLYPPKGEEQGILLYTNLLNSLDGVEEKPPFRWEDADIDSVSWVIKLGGNFAQGTILWHREEDEVFPDDGSTVTQEFVINGVKVCQQIRKDGTGVSCTFVYLDKQYAIGGPEVNNKNVYSQEKLVEVGKKIREYIATFRTREQP